MSEKVIREHLLTNAENHCWLVRPWTHNAYAATSFASQKQLAPQD